MQVKAYQNSHYAHFAFTGNAHVVVTLLTNNLSTYTLSPLRDALVPTTSGNSISFTLTVPRKIFLQCAGQTVELWLIADAPEDDAPVIGTPGVVNFATYSPDTTGNTDVMAKFITALDAISSGGTLFVNSGTYLLNNTSNTFLVIPANVTVYLAPGALIYCGNTMITQENFSLFSLSSGSAIKGRGCVDANGYYMRVNNPSTAYGSTVGTASALSSNCVIEGIVLRNSIYNAIEVRGSGWLVNNVKSFTDMFNLYQADSIDIFGYNNVINDVLLRGTDATFGASSTYAGWPGTTGGDSAYPNNYSGTCVNLNVTNVVAYGEGAIMYPATATADPIQNMYNYTFENMDMVVGYGRVLWDYPIQGANIFNVYYKSVQVDQCLPDTITNSPCCLFSAEIATWGGPAAYFGYSKNFYLSNVNVVQPQTALSDFMGYSATDYLAWTLNDVVIVGVTLNAANQGSYVTGTAGEDTALNAYSTVNYDTTVYQVVNVLSSSSVSSVGSPVIITFSRTGSTTAALTVPLTIRGTAAAGTDYITLPTSVTFTAGSSTATLSLSQLSSNNGRTIQIQMKNTPLQSAWMLGPNWQVLVTLTTT